jgi:branched-chain amino acid transport system substrate-binding protein
MFSLEGNNMEIREINIILPRASTPSQQKSLEKKTSQMRVHSFNSLHNITLFTILCFIWITQTPVLAAENSTITCGVILPLSGELNTPGTDLLQGIELAAEEINKNGGITGDQIDLRIADDQGDPHKALSLFQDMEKAGIPVVIGSYSTALTLPIAEETRDDPGTVLISPQANGESIYGISPWFYQMNAPVFSLAKFISEWLSYTTDRVAIIYIDDEYGRSVCTNIKTDLNNSSISITSTEPITMENQDYSAVSHRILDGAPDTIVVSMYDSREISILKNLSEAGFRGQVILTETVYMDNLERSASEVLSKFSLLTISANSNLVPGSHTDQFVVSYQKRFDQDPTRNIAGYGYDSMMVLSDAIRLGSEDGNISARSIQKGLNATRFYGVSGPKVFNSHHVTSTAFDRWVFKNGNFSLMSTSLI